MLELLHRSPLVLDEEQRAFLEALAAQAAIAIDKVALFDELQRSNMDLMLAYDATLDGLARALDLRSRATERHTERVTEMTLRLGRAMGLMEKDLVHVRRGALLHDIGKIGVPDAILLKQGPLSPAEWERCAATPRSDGPSSSPSPSCRCRRRSSSNTIIFAKMGLTDNVNNLQLGVLEVARRTILVLNENLTRFAITEAYNPRVNEAMNFLMVSPDKYCFPSGSGKYREAVQDLQLFIQDLMVGRSRFYTRVDNLIALLAAYKDILGSSFHNLLKNAEADGKPVSW